MSDFGKWLHRRGQEAMRRLWKQATDENTPQAERTRLLMFIAEMAIGKARTMEALPAPEEGQRYGVVILPEVMSAEKYPGAGEFPV